MADKVKVMPRCRDKPGLVAGRAAPPLIRDLNLGTIAIQRVIGRSARARRDRGTDRAPADEQIAGRVKELVADSRL